MNARAQSVYPHFDVVIVGAGVSGINAAQRVQTQLPGLSYTILEARGAIGGTWNLFQYPGIRSDSDLFTFGFPWRPWESSKAIADGASIQEYMAKSAAEYYIDKHIQFHHKLVSAAWSSESQTWLLGLEVVGEKQVMTAGFIIYGSGYYDYDAPLETIIPGIENFKGTKIHPQFWPENLDYTGKKIVIIGSGATAITLLPVLAEKAASVTMLQRSPTYVMAQPSVNTGSWIRKILPRWIANRFIRFKYMFDLLFFFYFCRAFPKVATRIIKEATEKLLPTNIAQDPNFKPKYNPWEQRLCVCPDGDFFAALRQGNAHVVTDSIQTVTETGILTTQGLNLDSDIIITATGLKMKFAGGTHVTVDGQPIIFSQKFMWKGALIQDVPNTACLLGYTNNSWTLGAEATSQLVYFWNAKYGNLVQGLEFNSSIRKAA
ncbi:FAD-containing monooxygenase EthA [Lachnellula suecica]|uniref:FAD-containing monooxygenase EthA n=1 Tax=Lachnellula suecica TaxID=602035 RepID=A0A8T9CAH2_9HELO|nr:FAD-containing monooxygenase EthA [Lachnellula suecica]